MEKQEESLQQDPSPPLNGIPSSGTHSTGNLSEKELDQWALNIFGENVTWFDANEDRLRREHPEWDGKFLAVSSRTPSKILAASEDRDVAFDTGLVSPELLALSAQLGVPPGCLVNSMFLGIDWTV